MHSFCLNPLVVLLSLVSLSVANHDINPLRDDGTNQLIVYVTLTTTHTETLFHTVTGTISDTSLVTSSAHTSSSVHTASDHDGIFHVGPSDNDSPKSTRSHGHISSFESDTYVSKTLGPDSNVSSVDTQNSGVTTSTSSSISDGFYKEIPIYEVPDEQNHGDHRNSQNNIENKPEGEPLNENDNEAEKETEKENDNESKPEGDNVNGNRGEGEAENEVDNENDNESEIEIEDEEENNIPNLDTEKGIENDNADSDKNENTHAEPIKETDETPNIDPTPENLKDNDTPENPLNKNLVDEVIDVPIDRNINYDDSGFLNIGVGVPRYFHEEPLSSSILEEEQLTSTRLAIGPSKTIDTTKTSSITSYAGNSLRTDITKATRSSSGFTSTVTHKYPKKSSNTKKKGKTTTVSFQKASTSIPKKFGWKNYASPTAASKLPNSLYHGGANYSNATRYEKPRNQSFFIFRSTADSLSSDCSCKLGALVSFVVALAFGVLFL